MAGVLTGRELAEECAGEPVGRVRELALANRDLRDLGALVEAEGLEELNLAFNRVASLEPLACLARLRSLNVVHNAVKSLKFLDGLGQLTVLKVSNNQVRSVAPLAALPHLEELWVHHNRIAELHDVACLADLPRLASLWLRPNPCCQRAAPRAYRPMLVKLLPGLRTLDAAAVTAEEREASAGAPDVGRPPPAPGAEDGGADGKGKGSVRSRMIEYNNRRREARTVRALKLTRSNLERMGAAEREEGPGTPSSTSSGGSSRAMSLRASSQTTRLGPPPTLRKIPDAQLPGSIAACMDMIPTFSEKKAATAKSPARRRAGRKKPQSVANSDPGNNLVAFERRYPQGTAAAVTVRRDGSAQAKWPNDDLAVSVERELTAAAGDGGGGAAGYRVFAAFRSSGQVAASFEPSGTGFVNYKTGKPFLVYNAGAAEGSVFSERGDLLLTWRGEVPPGERIEAKLDAQLGFHFARGSEGEPVPHIYVACNGVKHKFVQGFNPPGSTWADAEEAPEFLAQLEGAPKPRTPKKAAVPAGDSAGDIKSITSILSQLDLDLNKRLDLARSPVKKKE